jgi:AraC-like DNA-binding protein
VSARYEEVAPPAALAPWVQAVWRLHADAPQRRRIVPDGCMDVIWSASAGLIAVGANTTAFVAPVAAGHVALGVRLRPGGAPALLGVGAEALRDATVPAQVVLGEDAARLAAALESAPAGARREALLLGWLADRARTAPAPDPLVDATARRLARAPDVRLGAVARDLAVSERHLRRRVAAQVGYAPKRLARVLRLQRALAEGRRGAGLAEVAAAAGYADQAHFTHDCRELAGITPAALLRG